MAAKLTVAGATLIADPSGALVWPREGLLVVADLHLEKGSALARRGTLLPPYDTRTTLARLEAVLARWAPRRVISLGDGFHDSDGSRRLAVADRRRLAELVAAHDWIWLPGNHDPLPPEGLGGQVEAAVRIDGLTFCHTPEPDPEPGEVAGHLHPSAGITLRGRRVVRPCFVADQRRIVLPAFGSYTGGLNLRDAAIAGLFDGAYRAYLLGQRRIHVLGRAQIEG